MIKFSVDSICWSFITYNQLQELYTMCNCVCTTTCNVTMDTSLFSVVMIMMHVWSLSLYKFAEYTPGGIMSVSCSQVISETLI